jgi:hypothetical protein
VELRSAHNRHITSRILGIAEITDHKPQVNVHPGHISRVLRFCRDEMLRIAVSGYDPLIPPAEGKPLPRVKEIKVMGAGKPPH